MLHTPSQRLLLDPTLFHVRVQQIFLFIAFLTRSRWAKMECHLSLPNQTKIDRAKNQQSFTSFVYKNANKNIQNQKGRFFRSAAESGCFYHTLAARGREELFFQLCCCVSFSVVAGNSFRCYLPPIPVVPLCLNFGCGGKQFWVAQISFLIVAGNSFRCYHLHLPPANILGFFGEEKTSSFLSRCR